MNNNTFGFDNMFVAEYGIAGQKTPLMCSYISAGLYNDLKNGTWYANGENLHQNNPWPNILIPSYYSGIIINGLAYIQFIPGESNGGATISSELSTIEYTPFRNMSSVTEASTRRSLRDMSFIESPIITGIRLTGTANDQFNNYILRVYVIPGTQHDPY